MSAWELFVHDLGLLPFNASAWSWAPAVVGGARSARRPRAGRVDLSGRRPLLGPEQSDPGSDWSPSGVDVVTVGGARLARRMSDLKRTYPAGVTSSIDVDTRTWTRARRSTAPCSAGRPR